MLQVHKMNMRMNIHTYTHKNNVRTNIDYIHKHTYYIAYTQKKEYAYYYIEQKL